MKPFQSLILAPEFLYTVLGAFIGFFLFVAWEFWKDRKRLKENTQRALMVLWNEIKVNLGVMAALEELLGTESKLLVQESKELLGPTLRFSNSGFDLSLTYDLGRILTADEVVTGGVLVRSLESINTALDSRDTFKMTSKALIAYSRDLAGLDEALLGVLKSSKDNLSSWQHLIEGKMSSSRKPAESQGSGFGSSAATHRDLGLADLLFSTIFVATFAFKLDKLPSQAYQINLSTQPIPFLLFFGYSLLFILFYWFGIYALRKNSLMSVLLALNDSLAPFAALNLALWNKGIWHPWDSQYDLVLTLFGIIQLLLGIFGHKIARRLDGQWIVKRLTSTRIGRAANRLLQSVGTPTGNHARPGFLRDFGLAG